MKFLLRATNPEWSSKEWDLVFYNNETGEITRENVREKTGDEE